MDLNTARVRVKYLYDPESHNWCYVVPSLGIVGSAETREAAEQQAIEGVAFTLDCEHEKDVPAEGEVGWLHVSVQGAAVGSAV